MENALNLELPLCIVLHCMYLTLWLSCAAGEDYSGTTQTIDIGPGNSSQTVEVMVQIIDDNLLENVEQFTAQLSVPASQDRVMLGAAMATVNITDNDRELHVDTAVLSNSLLLLLTFPL